MSHLITSLEGDDLFQNKKAVEKATEQRNDLLSQLLSKLKQLIAEYQLNEKSLIKPESISNDYYEKISVRADTANSKAAFVENGVASVRYIKGSAVQPVFARE